jgi:hypothetical protein
MKSALKAEMMSLRLCFSFYHYPRHIDGYLDLAAL